MLADADSDRTAAGSHLVIVAGRSHDVRLVDDEWQHRFGDLDTRTGSIEWTAWAPMVDDDPEA